MTVINLSDFREEQTLLKDATKLSSDMCLALMDRTEDTTLMIMASAILVGRLVALVSPPGRGEEVLTHAISATAASYKSIVELHNGT